MNAKSARADWLITGGGPVALAFAAAISQKSRALLLSPPRCESRGRHYALNENSLRFLDSLGARPQANDVREFLLFSGGGKKPAVKLRAEEARIKRLCAVTGEEELLRELRGVLQNAQTAEAHQWKKCENKNGEIVLTEEGGKQFSGRFLAVADGANSPVARLLSVHCARGDFGQTALTMRARAPLADDCAAQWFGDCETLALLPLGGGEVSMIWSLPNARARECAGEEKTIDAEQLARFASERAGMTVAAAENAQAAKFPLFAIRRAVRACGRAVFLGDSARVIHPLAGQGLNLGFADAAELAGIAKEGGDINAAEFAAYLRRSERRGAQMHFLTSAMRAGKTANAALSAARRIPFLRRQAARFANAG